jgi:hypothetical protein
MNYFSEGICLAGKSDVTQTEKKGKLETY